MSEFPPAVQGEEAGLNNCPEMPCLVIAKSAAGQQSSPSPQKADVSLPLKRMAAVAEEAAVTKLAIVLIPHSIVIRC